MEISAVRTGTPVNYMNCNIPATTDIAKKINVHLNIIILLDG